MKQDKVGSIVKCYKFLDLLGEGQFGKVFKVMNMKEKELYSIKIIPKDIIDNDEKLKSLLVNEISIMQKIKHPNVIHLYDYFETSNNFYLVIDYCDEGSFSSFLLKNNKKFWKESEAINYLKQISWGFKELKTHKIMHRDFKLENILIKSNNTILIGDFGFSKIGEYGLTNLGTPITMAPELLDNSSIYTSKADLWSIGVVFYQLLYGEFPFIGNSKLYILKDILNKNCKVEFKDDIQKISNLSKNLLLRIFQKDQNERISWDEFFNHDLFKNKRNSKTIKVEENETLMKSYTKNSDLNKLNLDFDIDQYFRLGFNFYNHYINLIIFINKIAQNLKDFEILNEKSSAVWIVLLYEKSKIILNNLKSSLELKNNIFNIDYFDEFVYSEYYNILILNLNNNFIKNCDELNIIKNKINNELIVEYNSLNTQIKNHKKLLAYLDTKIFEFTIKLNNIKYLIKGYNSGEKNGIKNFINNNIYYLALIPNFKIYFPIFLDKKFFSWKNFYKNFLKKKIKMEKLNQILENNPD